MRVSERTVAVTLGGTAVTHRTLQRQALQEHRSLAEQVAHLLEHALAVEEREQRALAAERAADWARQAGAPAGGVGPRPGDLLERRGQARRWRGAGAACRSRCAGGRRGRAAPAAPY